MRATVDVNIAVEGDLDEVVLSRLLESIGIGVATVYGKRGKGSLRKNVSRYNQAARHSPWVVLADLNSDAECAPLLVDSWLSERHPNLQLRIAVRAVEAWLLADGNALARFLGVPQARIPAQPENEANPKAALISVARRSRRKTTREDIVPPPMSTARQGPAYTSRLIDFAMRYWNPKRAAARAPGLRRTMDSLSRWKPG